MYVTVVQLGLYVRLPAMGAGAVLVALTGSWVPTYSSSWVALTSLDTGRGSGGAWPKAV